MKGGQTTNNPHSWGTSRDTVQRSRLSTTPQGLTLGALGGTSVLGQPPTGNVIRAQMGEGAPSGRPAPLGMRGRDAQIAPFTDPRMVLNPRPGDSAMVIDTEAPPRCPDSNGVKFLIDRYRGYVQKLEEARAGRASAQNDRERADWDPIIADYERALEQTRPTYEEALACTTRA